MKKKKNASVGEAREICGDCAGVGCGYCKDRGYIDITKSRTPRTRLINTIRDLSLEYVGELEQRRSEIQASLYDLERDIARIREKLDDALELLSKSE